MKRYVLRMLAVLAVGASPAWSDYSAVNDFPTVTSSTSAQNGVWSYGYSTAVPGNFTLDTTAITDYFGDGNAVGFYTPTSGSYGSFPLPAVLKNISGTTLSGVVGTIGPWPTDLLLMHPGPGGAYSTVSFTAPNTGTYVVKGEFVAMGNYTGVTMDAVSTTGPGATTLFSTNSSTRPSTFDLVEHLTAGESLDFTVGLGPQGQFYYDSTGFNATVTPEPMFYGVLALGLMGLYLANGRRLKA
jgi:hypothetical protein